MSENLTRTYSLTVPDSIGQQYRRFGSKDPKSFLYECIQEGYEAKCEKRKRISHLHDQINSYRTSISLMNKELKELGAETIN